MTKPSDTLVECENFHAFIALAGFILFCYAIYKMLGAIVGRKYIMKGG